MSPTTEHQMQQIALFLYDQTKHGKRTTCRQVADAIGAEPTVALCALNLAQVQPIETPAGLLTVAKADPITGPHGQPTATYMATLSKLQPA